MTVIYPAIIHEEEGNFWAEFPDLQGCQTFGDTLAETMGNAREALSGYCAVLLEQKSALPAASPVQSVEAGENAFVTLVDAKPADRQRAVKKTLSIPAWLNTLAEEAHAPYSSLLQSALEKYLGLS